MKVTLLTFIVSMSFGLITAQEYQIQSLRYNEDFSFLKDSTELNLYEQIKFIPLDSKKKSILSIGGEYRFQYQFFKNEDWGDISNDSDGFILSRLLFHASLKLNKSFRLFTQIKSNSIQSREVEPKSIDVNAFDIHQSFIDYTLKPNKSAILLRVGRQETLFGSQRLVSVREGPNNRLTFDGLKLEIQNKSVKTTSFYLHPVTDKPEILDDKWFATDRFFGVYTVINKVKWIDNIDLYYIGLNKKSATFDEISGKERRHSLGTRVWKKTKNWSIDFETVYQFGKFEHQDINAYTISLHTNYELDNWKMKPILGLKTEIISGDKSKSDNQLNSFNPLYPRGAYFGLAALIGPVNLIDFHPYIEFNINKKMVMGLDYDIFWRYSTNDGLYGPNARPMYFASNSTEKFIGKQLGANLEINPYQFLSIVVEGTWFDSGNYLKQVSKGNDILFAALTLQFKY